MSKLESEITIRVMDTFGIFTKDMPTIINDTFKVKNNVWSARIELDKDQKISVVYSIVNNNHYMVISNKANDNFCYCLIVCDHDNTNEELNKVYIHNRVMTASKQLDDKFRESLATERSILLNGFEIIRLYNTALFKHSPTYQEFDILSKFVDIVKIN